MGGQEDLRIPLEPTLKPFTYETIAFLPHLKQWAEYSQGAVSEFLLTESRLYVTFTLRPAARKPMGTRLAGVDLNFHNLDYTSLSGVSGGRPEPPHTQQLSRIVQVQNDFSRRRRKLQLHIRNPEKRARKLAETRGRQRNRVKDALQQLSTKLVRENPDTSFVFEDLKGVRENGEKERGTTSRSKKLRTYLNRWPYRALQGMMEYKSRCRTLYVSPRGTSSECPVCGGVLEHPAWAVSRCRTCGVDYDRDRLASLVILRRGLRLCGQPFAASAVPLGSP